MKQIDDLLKHLINLHIKGKIKRFSSVTNLEEDGDDYSDPGDYREVTFKYRINNEEIDSK